MSELLPYQELTPELRDFGVSLLEKIHDEVRSSWNGFGAQLWLQMYIKELKEVKDDSGTR